MEQYGISVNHARTLTGDKKTAVFYEAVAGVAPALAATWVADTLLGELNYRDMHIGQVPPDHFMDLLVLVRDGEITDRAAVDVLRVVLDQARGGTLPEMPADIVLRLNLGKSGGDEFLPAIREAIEKNPQAVADFKSGKDMAVNFLVGQVMKATRGRADAREIGAMIREQLTKEEE
jgi:aspartyl-tRNA(Asn)/glutamyl-tRNA(Gln) amidotransferase subunit B